MTATFIIIFGVLSILHWLYETCILPDLRQHLIYGLFGLRDELRRAKVEGEITDEAAYKVLHDSLNKSIGLVPVADCWLLHEFRSAMRHNSHLKEQAEKRIKILQDSSDEIIRGIRTKSNKIFASAILAGMGGWMLYLIPIALLLSFFNTFKDAVRSIMAIPSANLASILTRNEPVGA